MPSWKEKFSNLFNCPFSGSDSARLDSPSCPEWFTKVLVEKLNKYINSDRSFYVVHGVVGSFSGDLLFDSFSSHLVSLLISAVPGDSKGEDIEQEHTQDKSTRINEWGVNTASIGSFHVLDSVTANKNKRYLMAHMTAMSPNVKKRSPMILIQLTTAPSA